MRGHIRRSVADNPRAGWQDACWPEANIGVEFAITKFAICNELFEGWDFGRACRFVKSVGYDGLEIAPFTLATPITDLPRRRRAEIRQQAADAGIDLIGLHWLLAKTDGLYLTSPDPAVRARTSQYLVALAKACCDLGGSLMVFGSPAQRSLLPGVVPDRAFEWAAEVFQSALPAVADSDVTICMEPLSPSETDFVNTCEQALQLIERVDHPNFVLHLDVKAMATESAPITDLIRHHGKKAGHFHANDPNRRGPGFGDADFVPIFQALQDAGYNRWVSVEVFDYAPDPETIARRSLTYMQDCLSQLNPRATK
jgi:sugar phosphate isomerase/epimerase